MSENMFRAGIEPGGVDNTSDAKLLICYLFSRAGRPLTRLTALEILSEYGLVNYFLFSDAFSSLIALGHLRKEGEYQGEETYVATDVGRQTASTLETALPLSVREKAVRASVRVITQQELLEKYRVEIRDVPGGCQITCGIPGEGSELLSVSLFVPDRMQAEEIRENFLKSPAGIYKAIAALLTGDRPLAEDALNALRRGEQ